MKLSYSITQADYVSMLTAMMKRAEHTPVRMVSFLILTVIQMCWAGYMLITADLAPKDRVILGALSVTLACINILYRALRRKRAESTLRNLQTSGQILPAYWEEHVITAEDGEISLDFGGIHLAAACPDIGPVLESDGLLLLYVGAKFFEAVPLRAFSADGDKSRFLGLIRESGRAAEAEKPAVPEDAVWSLEYETAGGDFIASQVRCFRAVFLRQSILKPFPMAKLIACVYMLYYALTGADTATSLLLIFFVLAINLKTIVVFSPAARAYLLRKVPELGVNEAGQLRISVSLTQDRAVVHINGRATEMRLRDVSLCRELGGFAAVYADSWPALMIPHSAFASGEAAHKLMSFVRARSKKV